MGPYPGLDTGGHSYLWYGYVRILNLLHCSLGIGGGLTYDLGTVVLVREKSYLLSGYGRSLTYALVTGGSYLWSGYERSLICGLVTGGSYLWSGYGRSLTCGLVTGGSSLGSGYRWVSPVV